MNKETKIYLGIDWGEKRIGLAMADSETNIALPFRTVSTPTEVLDILTEEDITDIVVGSPIKMSGAVADNVAWLSFIKQLKEKNTRPVHLFDERLSSLAADALAGAAKEKARRDDIAAAIILQDYLDRIV